MGRQHIKRILLDHGVTHISGALLDALSADGLEAADELARLREALKPFAEAAEDLEESTPDSCSMWEHHVSINVEAGDFRRAAAAIRSGDAG